MVLFTATLTMLTLFASASTQAQTMIITRAGARAIRQAPTENFTGSVRVEMLFGALEPSHASGGSVTFEPGARTAWHSHPRGQILIITAGTAPWARAFRLPPSDPARAKALIEELGAVAPKFVQITNDVVFDDLWRRSDLTVRDRSLVTIAALAAMATTTSSICTCAARSLARQAMASRDDEHARSADSKLRRPPASSAPETSVDFQRSTCSSIQMLPVTVNIVSAACRAEMLSSALSR